MVIALTVSGSAELERRQAGRRGWKREMKKECVWSLVFLSVGDACVYLSGRIFSSGRLEKEEATWMKTKVGKRIWLGGKKDIYVFVRLICDEKEIGRKGV